MAQQVYVVAALLISKWTFRGFHSVTVP